MRRRVESDAGASGAGESSSVTALLPAGAPNDAPASSESEDAGASSSSAPGVPPLPPDDGGDGAGADDPGADRGERAGAGDRGRDAEAERLERVTVLRFAFAGVFAMLPPQYGGGPVTEDESVALANAWELPLRPYWDAMMGPWMGALVTTAVIVAPRVMAAQSARGGAADSGGAVA